jgi:hypothetical protein
MSLDDVKQKYYMYYMYRVVSEENEGDIIFISSMDWFKRKSTGNHRFSHEIWGVPVNFSLKPIH